MGKIAMRRRRLAAAWPLLAITGIPASGHTAGHEDVVARCGDRDPEIAIPACTALIEKGVTADAEFFPHIVAQRAAAYALKYDYDRAIKDYNHAIKLRPDRAAFFDGRGFAHANRLNFELAIKDYDQAIKLEPKRATAFYRRGLAKFGICDIDGADADIAKARALDANVGN
jgi:tetratricopeptide (TPR) repeat protein